MLTKVELKNGNVYLVMTEGKNPCYKKLAEALIDRLTAAQLVKYTIQTLHGKLVRFMDLVECFDLHDGEQNDQKCICGASIHNGRIVQNIDDGICHVIGSTCKDNWVEMNIANDGHHCKYCLRANQTGDHIACKPRIQLHDQTRACFEALKTNVQMNRATKRRIVRHWTGLVRFGRIAIRRKVARFFIKAMDMRHKYAYGTYQTRPISYYRLLKTNPNYCEWICQKSTLNRWVKDKIAQIGSAIYD